MYSLRWYQQLAIDKIYKYLQNEKGNPIVVAPTGSGKSLIIADFIKSVLYNWPDRRIMMITHSKELISQNAEKLKSVMPNAPVGIFSAGLKLKENDRSVVFGGIQSIAPFIKKCEDKNIYHFGKRDLLLIDECHLISPSQNTQYNYVITKLKELNPSLRVVGFTATPYRLKQGLLTEGEHSLFDGVCLDLNKAEYFKRLINEGFLSTLIPLRTETYTHMENVSIDSTGEFNKTESELEVSKVIVKAIEESLKWANLQNRKRWICFTQGISNAEKVSDLLQSFGVSSTFVHSKVSQKENDLRIQAFKNGDIQCLVNSNKLTTGFDCPEIDMIIMLKPTTSASLWVQMLGRGMRPAQGKDYCLVLDFVENTLRLGTINNPVIPNAKKKKGKGDLPVKVCPKCNVFLHTSAKFCPCGYEFKTGEGFEKIKQRASELKLIDLDEIESKVLTVNQIVYTKHQKNNAKGEAVTKPVLRVSYFCGTERIENFISLKGEGYALKMAAEWWFNRTGLPMPESIDEACLILKTSKQPCSIEVVKNGKYYKVLSERFDYEQHD